ncbi:NIPSNAP family protein [Lacisediminimonas profundi]|uniref:NIPSNAP family protein n=1 Tax=Lacisediminimonas profundi TaxID=2603856 RepID=UPI00124AF4D5|nr:NIPSNAP family protein [Lacisediminimonas profundi]
MIYELTTLTTAAARLKDVVSALDAAASACPAELVAAWTTEVGRVNDVLLLRRYDETSSASGPTEFTPGGKNWLSDVLPMTQDVQIEQFRVVPYMTPPSPGKAGAIYEMRSYVYRPGMLDELLETWKEPLLNRTQVSPAPLVMYSINSRALRFIHLWVYESYDDRLRIRAGEVAKGTWPPPGGRARWMTQENSLLVPMGFSPMK